MTVTVWPRRVVVPSQKPSTVRSAGIGAAGTRGLMRSSVPNRMVGAGGGAVLVVTGVASIEESPRTISSRALLKTGESPISVTEVGTEPMPAMIDAGSGAYRSQASYPVSARAVAAIATTRIARTETR